MTREQKAQNQAATIGKKGPMSYVRVRGAWCVCTWYAVRTMAVARTSGLFFFVIGSRKSGSLVALLVHSTSFTYPVKVMHCGPGSVVVGAAVSPGLRVVAGVVAPSLIVA